MKLGSMLAEIGRQARLTGAELDLINQRDGSPPRAVSSE
jgi:hypothetical protein